MNAGAAADIGRRGHTRIGDFVHCGELLFDDQRYAGFVVAFVNERRDLDVVERHLLVAPLVSPQRDELLHILAVQVRVSGVDVRFALIPDESLGRVVDQRMDHRVVQLCGLIRGLMVFVFFNLVLFYFLGGFHVHPGFDAGSAPVRFDQADRNAEHFV